MTRVLLVSKYPLFGRGIQSLLCHKPDIEIIGQVEPAQAIEQIKDLEPDVVITDSNNVTQDPNSVVAFILRTRCPPKLIVLNLEDNSLHIYHGEERTAKGVDDLVAAIRTNQPAIP